MHSDGIRMSLGRESEAYLEQERAERLEKKSARLTSAIEQLEVDAEIEVKPLPHAVAEFEAIGKKVFLVHGRDTGARESCARFLSRLGLEVVILHEQADQGQTVIEKFVAHSNVGFAVVLLTADDRGGERNDQFDAQRPRARQNVIFELGFFLGKLGRPRVCALYEEGVELPSDYHGVIYVPIDGGESWKLRLAKELKAAGLEVDMNEAV
jgi:predicted nucleotide-binding protein